MSGSASVSNKAVALTGLVPMIHVADVEGSVEFYRKLGFEVGNSVPPVGPKHWAWLYSPAVENWKNGANLMVTRTARPLDADAQDVLFYLYASDLVALRDDLIAKAIKVSEINYPEYSPKGEFRIDDPDGYCLMVAQATQDTP
jgi:hypothetical protein